MMSCTGVGLVSAVQTVCIIEYSATQFSVYLLPMIFAKFDYGSLFSPPSCYAERAFLIREKSVKTWSTKVVMTLSPL